MPLTNIRGAQVKDQSIDTADLADKAVTLAKMADMATASLLYRKTAGTGAPEVNTLAQLKTDLAIPGGDIFGTGTVGQVAEFVTDTKHLQAAKIIGPASNIVTFTNAHPSTIALDIASGKIVTITAPDSYELYLAVYTSFSHATEGKSTYTLNMANSAYLTITRDTDAFFYSDMTVDEEEGYQVIKMHKISPVHESILKLENNADADKTWILTGGGTIALGGYTLTVAGTASVSGTNTGDNAANSLYDIGSDTQAYNAKLTAIAALANGAGWLHNDGAGAFAYSTPTAANVGAEAAGAIAIHAAIVTAVHGLVNAGAYTFTIPATGTAALLGIANTFTAAQTVTMSTAAAGIIINGTDTNTSSSVPLQIASTSTGLGSAVYGTDINVQYNHIGVGSSPSFTGLNISIAVNSTATQDLTNLYGIYLSVLNNVVAPAHTVVSSGYGIYIANLGTELTAAMVSAYGIYMENISSASSINYAIYTKLGKIHFGDAMDIIGAIDTIPITSTKLTSTTTSSETSFYLIRKTTGDMTDTFGPGILFGIQDNAAGPNYIGGIYAYRNGADTYGGMDFQTRNAGGQHSSLTIDKDGTITLAVDLAVTEGGTGASTAAAAATSLSVTPATGWNVAPGAAWAYASATTITVASGAASVYEVGDKVLWVSGGANKFAYIIGVADTVLTIFGNAVVNGAAITAQYYSRQQAPLGFPQWFALATNPTFDVTIMDDAAGGQPVITEFRISMRGRMITVHASGTGTKAGANASIVCFAQTALPVPANTSAWSVAGEMFVYGATVGRQSGPFGHRAYDSNWWGELNHPMADNEAIYGWSLIGSYEV